MLLLDHLHRAAATDERSGLLVYDAWRARAEPILSRRRDPEDLCALLIIDIDDFKSINDTYGHLAGDSVVRAVAEVIKAEIRTADVPGRFGGDEFVVLLDSLHTHRAAEWVAHRIRRAVTALTLPAHTPGDPRTITDLTVSIGAALHTPGSGLDLAALLWAADAALYHAKRAGKNTVRVHPD